jgi:hypothetical protein
MTTKEIAERVVALNRTGYYKNIYNEFYTDETVSIENWGEREEYKGIAAIQVKAEKFESTVEAMHDMQVSEPLIADKSFAVTFYMDVTFNAASGMPGRMQMTELAVYTVRDGKIVKEEFQA